MKIFITTQKKLAAVTGITPEHLSSVKSGKQGLSDGLAARLEETTGINRTTWASSTRKAILRQELNKFFKNEKDSEHLYITGRRLAK